MWLYAVLAALFLVASAPPAEAFENNTGGVKILLNPDGTLKYFIVPEAPADTYTKPQDSVKVFKSGHGFYEVWFNPLRWEPGEPGRPDAELNLTGRRAKAYAFTIAGREQTTLEKMKEAALDEMNRYAADVRIISERKLNVNGAQVLSLRFDANVEGRAFSYMGYYWAGRLGSVQFVAFTDRDVFEDLRADLQDLLNGLVIAAPSEPAP